MPDCTCNSVPDGEKRIWCERHQVWKTHHWVKLCQTRADYRQAWDDGRGPGQVKGATPGKTTIKRTPQAKNVGDYLKDLTAELNIHPKHGCGCYALANEMNRLGPSGCLANRDKLVGKMQTNAKQYSWGDVMQAAVAAVLSGLAWKINPLDPYGSLLDEAIRRTENADKELNHANPN